MNPAQAIAIFTQPLKSWINRLRWFSLWVVLATLLAGCVDYEIGVQFNSPSQGVITQHLAVSERLQNLSQTTVQQWLKAFEQQTRGVGGTVKRLPDHSLQVTIPFRDGRDLEQKFNQFFQPQGKAANALSNFPPISSHLSLRRNNFLLLERTRLVYVVDLRNLGVASSSGSLLFSPGTLLGLTFHLATPWKAKVFFPQQLSTVQQRGGDLTWQLLPGVENQLDVVFWMPNWLGIGTVGIILLVGLGYYLRYSTPAKSLALTSSVSSSSTQ